MNRTKDELLQSCIEQFEHIDLTNENKTLATTKSLVMEIKQALAIPVVSTRYLCECGKVQIREDMRREYDFGYDQLCCTKCGDVLIDYLHGVVHCNVR